MSAPLVSVVLPVRQEERWVGRALRSLRRQTVTAFEVLVVDDHSTDGTAAVVEQHAAADPRIRLVANEGTGFVDALNTGTALAAAPLVARLDADDYSLPRRLEEQLAELERNPRLLALGTYGWRLNEHRVPVSRLRTGPAGRAGYRAAMAQRRLLHLTHSSVVFRRDAVLRAGGYPADYYPADDLKLWNSLAAHGEVYALPRMLTLYTLRRRSISASDALAMWMQSARVAWEVQHGAGGDLPPGRALEALGAEERRALLMACAKRSFGRALVNFRFDEAARAVREGGMRLEDVRAEVRRALSG